MYVMNIMVIPKCLVENRLSIVFVVLFLIVNIICAIKAIESLTMDYWK